MRFIKRILFVIILLVIAFFVFRLINPQSAKDLLNDMKSFSNTTFGTHFSLTTPLLVEDTGSILSIEDIFGDDTGFLFEFTDDEELLLSDVESFEDNDSVSMDSIDMDTSGSVSFTGTIVTSGSSSTGSLSTSTSTKSTTTTSSKSSSSNGLSSQDIRDFKTLFGN